MASNNFVRHMATKTGATITATKDYVDTLEAEFYEFLKENGSLKFAGMTFSVDEIAARNGFNPQTKEAIVIPAHKRLKVKVAPSVRDMVKSF